MSVGINSEVRSTASELCDEVDDADDKLAADSDTCNSDSLAAESENGSELSTADLLESSSESNDNEADELDMSFTETDNANTCLDDVTDETVRVSTTTADGALTNDINAVDIKLAATASADVNDHRHFIGSDRTCSDLKHDAHMSDSILVSHVVMDIN